MPAASRAAETGAGLRSDLEALLWPDPVSGGQHWDQTGRLVAAGALRDRVVVVGFVSTQCPITCVVLARDLDALVAALPAPLRERVAVLAVSVDPDRDDARALNRFGEALTIGPDRVRLLTSDRAAVAHYAAALRYPRDRLPAPPPTLLAFDRAGTLAMTYGADLLDRSRLLRDLALLDRFERGIRQPAREDGAPTSRSP
ncbi:SCO family protein [Methylobacterium sp. JK268]